MIEVTYKECEGRRANVQSNPNHLASHASNGGKLREGTEGRLAEENKCSSSMRCLTLDPHLLHNKHTLLTRQCYERQALV